MKRLLPIVFVLSALSLTVACKDKEQAGDAATAVDASAEAVAYNVDTAATVVEWTGSKQIASHSGIVKLLTGIVYVKGDKIESGNFTINMNSIQATDVKSAEDKANLEAHLKGTSMDEKADHFFNVRKYPEAKFEITKIGEENGKTMIEGNLTIKGTTKNVKFPATVKVSDTEVTIDSEKFPIDRTQWKVNYGSKSVFSDLTDNFINDEIQLAVKLRAKKA